MTVIEAIQNPKDTPLSSVEFKAVKVYPKERDENKMMYKILTDTPGDDKVYVTLFKDNPVTILEGKSYLLSAQITKGGARGLTIDEYNNKRGIKAFDNTTLKSSDGSAAPTQATATEVANVEAASQPTQDEMVKAFKAVAPKVQSGGLNQTELIGRFCEIYAESYQKMITVMQEVHGEKAVELAHDFAVRTVENCSLWWFGQKDVPKS